MEEIEKLQERPYAHDYSDSKVLMYKNLDVKRGLDIKEVMEKSIAF